MRSFNELALLRVLLYISIVTSLRKDDELPMTSRSRLSYVLLQARSFHRS